jgi:DNA mismatch repair ATPase MutS
MQSISTPMKFKIDNQTISDLGLFEKRNGEKSVFQLFNFTKSEGGYKRLEYLFSNPLVDIDLIEKRIEIIKHLQKPNVSIFQIDKGSLNFIEYYLIQQNIPNRFSISKSFVNALAYKIKPKNEYYVIKRGIRFLIDFLNNIYDFAINLEQENICEPINNYKLTIIDKIEKSSLKAVLGCRNRYNLFPHEFGKLDYCFRNVEINNVREVLDIVYEFDAFYSIVLASNKYKFTLPVFIKEPNCYNVQGLFHPFLENPVENDFEIIPDKNVLFLTGPNMAGKSTFLKSLSISVYLAHLGLPVPARSLNISKFNGLLTTINLSDNINKGYSHFYNEVLRVKYVAERINEIGNIFVVFDELFRGTNVKDAYDASLSVISAFSNLNNGVFTISTHIVEVGEKLIDNKSVFFKCFEADLINETPHYNYKIMNGVTDERLGMYILKKEKVIETIENTI